MLRGLLAKEHQAWSVGYQRLILDTVWSLHYAKTWNWFHGDAGAAPPVSNCFLHLGSPSTPVVGPILGLQGPQVAVLSLTGLGYTGHICPS